MENTEKFNISESAAKQIAFLLEQEEDQELMLRIIVEGGGCAGFQYKFDFDKPSLEDDIVLEKHGIKVVIDQISLDILNGSELDYVEDLIGSSFQIKNPNASSTCGCGTSFSI